jgi:predicted transcriptional regulator
VGYESNQEGRLGGLLCLKRNRLEIIENILLITKEEKLKTCILYSANLSFTQGQKYLGFLLHNGLLNSDEINGKTYYKTTEKGFSFLESFQEIQNLLGL